jgi:lantibiotic biosynthesis protein
VNPATLVEATAARITSGDDFGEDWPGQSLAEGAAGVALLRIELAAAGLSDWKAVETSLRLAASEPISTGRDAALYYGAPALEFVVRAAVPYLPNLVDARARLEVATDAVVRARLQAATVRRTEQALPTLREFDLIRGLTGLGAVLLTRGPSTPLLGEILSHLVALTKPATDAGEVVPGWWTLVGPAGQPTPDFPGGHSNNGMAHGVAGVVALLSLCLHAGTVVDGQREAIRRIIEWFDQWSMTGAPYWVRRTELGCQAVYSPARPSWCYGAFGNLRARQLAARALDDANASGDLADAARTVLTDPAMCKLTDNATLCHGWAGLVVTAQAIAADAPEPHSFSDSISRLADELAEGAGRLHKTGLLEGAAGAALALLSLHYPPATNWTRVLVIS